MEDSNEIKGSLELEIRGLVLEITASGRWKEQAITLEKVINESTKDVKISRLIQLIWRGEVDEAWSEELAEFRKERMHLSEKDGILMYKNRLVIPESLQPEVLDSLHSAHQGCSSMEARAADLL